MKIGQAMTATVIRAAPSGEVTLRINGVNVTAKTRQPLTPGQQITVRVTSLGAKPGLEIVASGTAGPTTSRPLPAVAPPLITLTTAARGAGDFTIGQRVLALVTGARPDGTLQLQTATGRLAARAPASFAGGQLLELAVVKAGKAPTLAVTGLSDGPDMINALLRAALPRQHGLAPLMSLLTTLASGDGKPAAALPPAVRDAIAHSLRNLSTSRDASSARGLQHALHNSGMFFESRLLAQASPAADPGLGTDFKSGLFRLIDALLRGSFTAPGEFSAARQPGMPPAAPPLRGAAMQAQARAAPGLFTSIDELLGRLLQQAEGVLARLHISQLSALPPQDQAQPYLTFELPLRHGNQVDIVQLRIERDSPGAADEAERQWTIQIAFDLEHLGPVHARVTLQQHTVSTVFWAEHARTADLFEQHMAELQRKLADAGLTVGTLRCQTGTPPVPAARGTANLLRNLEA